MEFVSDWSFGARGFRCIYTSALDEIWLLNFEASTLNHNLLSANVAVDVCRGKPCGDVAHLVSIARDQVGSAEHLATSSCTPLAQEPLDVAGVAGGAVDSTSGLLLRERDVRRLRVVRPDLVISAPKCPEYHSWLPLMQA